MPHGELSTICPSIMMYTEISSFVVIMSSVHARCLCNLINSKSFIIMPQYYYGRGNGVTHNWINAFWCLQSIYMCVCITVYSSLICLNTDGACRIILMKWLLVCRLLASPYLQQPWYWMPDKEVFVCHAERFKLFWDLAINKSYMLPGHIDFGTLNHNKVNYLSQII